MQAGCCFLKPPQAGPSRSASLRTIMAVELPRYCGVPIALLPDGVNMRRGVCIAEVNHMMLSAGCRSVWCSAERRELFGRHAGRMRIAAHRVVVERAAPRCRCGGHITLYTGPPPPSGVTQ